MTHIARIAVLSVVYSAPLLAQELATQPSKDKDLVTVKRGTIAAVVDADGYFEPVDALEVKIRPKAYQGDLLVGSAAAHGARVKKGDSILELDSTQIQKQIAAAANELATVQANQSKAEADVQLGESGDALAMQMAQAELSNAEAGLKWWEQVDGAHMLKGAELNVRNAKNNVEDQGDELDQLKKMYKTEELTNATADIVVKRAVRNLELANIRQGMSEESAEKVKQFDYQTARQKLVFNIEKEKQEMAQLRATQEQQKALRQTALTNAKLATDKAKIKLDELREDATAFSVKAPFDGIVLYGQLQRGAWQNSDPRSLRPDEKVNASQVVLTVFNPGKLRLMADVPESKLGMVKSGLPARVIPTGHPESTCSGTCGEPSPVGAMKEWGQLFATPLELSKVDSNRMPGEKAIVRIDAGRAENVLMVPGSAVVRGRVKVRNSSGEDEWRDVVTGRSDGENIEILDGLKEGEQILTKPAASR